MAEKKLTGYPSIDMPWMKQYSGGDSYGPLPKCTVYENIVNQNRDYPADIALEYFGRKITYQELFNKVEQTKRAFQKLGVKKNDKVGLFTSSTPETIYAILALCRIGAVANMINPLFTREQIVDRVNETGANLMIVLDQLYGKIGEIVPELCVKTFVVVPVVGAMPVVTRILASAKMKKNIPHGSGQIRTLRWDDFIAMGKNADAQPDEPYEPDRPLIMVYSSGTTGASKGIVLTNDGINATISHYNSPALPYDRGYTFLQIVPVWFSTGIVLSVFMPLFLGITVILEPVFSKENFARDIKKHAPNMILGATSLWVYAASCPELKGADLSQMGLSVRNIHLQRLLPSRENSFPLWNNKSRKFNTKEICKGE